MSLIRQCFMVDVKDPINGRIYGTYVLANDVDHLNVILSSYKATEREVSGGKIDGKSVLAVVQNRPEIRFNRWLKEGGAKRIDQIVHQVVFLLGRLEDKNIKMDNLFCDGGLVHELIHLQTKVSPVREVDTERIKEFLTILSDHLPELWLTENERGFYEETNRSNHGKQEATT